MSDFEVPGPRAPGGAAPEDGGPGTRSRGDAPGPGTAWRYRACGFELESPVPVRPLLAGEPGAVPQVRLTVPSGETALLPGPRRGTWALTEGGVLLRGGDGHGCLCREGREIRFLTPLQELDETSPLLAPPLGVTCWLRGDFVLHAGVVERGQRCFALAGPSGAGKSTALAALCERGYRLVTDDLAPCRLEGSGVVVPSTWPAWRRTLQPGPGWRTLPFRPGKAVSTEVPFAPGSWGLAGVFLLRRPSPEGLRVRRLPRLQALPELRLQAWYPRLAERVLGAQVVWERAARVASQVPVVSVARPSEAGPAGFARVLEALAREHFGS